MKTRLFPFTLLLSSFSAHALTIADAPAEAVKKIFPDITQTMNFRYGKSGTDGCTFFGFLSYEGEGENREVEEMTASVLVYNAAKTVGAASFYLDNEKYATHVFLRDARILPSEKFDDHPTLVVQSTYEYPAFNAPVTYFQTTTLKFFAKAIPTTFSVIQRLDAVEISTTATPDRPAKTLKCSGLMTRAEWDAQNLKNGGSTNAPVYNGPVLNLTK